ncbi:MAG TPA: carbon starvation protein A [Tepidisphaeraceae bacterium]|jgi:carbon starvation protein|nr:carbon starvation protein A [Tepidisphaeraceae bacterium]
MHAMPLLLGILCVMAIAYRYYSNFLAFKVVGLDDSRQTPAYQFEDGQNYHPTPKWVLFGHHFAAISGAGPLIGPVLAAQFGYMPGLLWIVIGVCLAGAVQDFIALAASMRRGGRSLAQIALSDVGPAAGTAATIAILFILVIALAGLGKVVVKALGGEEVRYPAGSSLVMPQGMTISQSVENHTLHQVPPNSKLTWMSGGQRQEMPISEAFTLKIAGEHSLLPRLPESAFPSEPLQEAATPTVTQYDLPTSAVRLVPGSSWGTFTIAATIPIALFVGLYTYRIRKGRVIEASIIGAILTLVATVAGGYVANSPIAPWFNWTDTQVTWAMAGYGFVASVLPVWVLLCPRDYLSSFLKVGTIIALILGVFIANPELKAPAFNTMFFNGGPTVKGAIFPFLFITIMCGAISGFHALVSSGTTPKMIKQESHARPIGYGAMLIEGTVGVVAMIAAATLPVGDYYAMNTDLGMVPQYHDRFVEIGADVDHLNVYEERTQEALRGRTGGAVTLAVGMAHIFDGIAQKVAGGSQAFVEGLWKYWYHFAIMFEALFILTTIDTGTRVGRFLIQEIGGKLIHPKFGQTDWWPSAVIATALMVCGWAYFLGSDNFATIWGMFGVANQMLAVIALAILSAYLANIGKRRYLWVTICPMLLVLTTTTTAAFVLGHAQVNGFMTQMSKAAGTRNGTILFNSALQTTLIVIMLTCTAIVLVSAARRIWGRPEVRAE